MLDKNQGIYIRVSPEERRQIKARMDEMGIKNMSAYMRKMAIDGYSIILDLSDVKEAVHLLRSASNNMNQYAKKANETDSIYKADIDDMKKRQEEIWILMKEILARLATIR